eukprot:TRINITY_DN3070_c0_g1_i1.p1 TRINITY_DN3070_c0_g1~~TRINITY_DN3070_c0_g1_i1.p1  ORF type:complete len:359 (-),score=129.90 TRINITY_DN3070_c0_g1_i1:12-1088(-)
MAGLEQEEYSLVVGPESRFESPLQKFNRLKLEIHKLIHDVKCPPETPTNNTSTTPDLPTTLSPSEMTQNLLSLQTDLLSSLQPKSSSSSAASSQSSPTYHQLVDEVTNFSSSPSSTSTPPAQPTAEEQLKYELFGQLHQQTPTAQKVFRQQKLLELDKRILFLEELLGSPSQKQVGEGNVLQMLSKLSSLIGQHLNNNQNSPNDQTAPMISQMERLVQLLAQSSLNSSSSQKDLASDKVEEIFQKRVQWEFAFPPEGKTQNQTEEGRREREEGEGEGLERLNLRLQKLKFLHHSSSLFLQLLSLCESKQTQINELISQNSLLFPLAKKEFVEEVEKAEKNLKVLEKKIQENVPSNLQK